MKKVDIAKLLAFTPNIMGGKGEIIQFFHSPQFNIDEENEGNIIEDFMSFRGQLDKDLLELKDFSINDTFLKDQPYLITKIPKKVQIQLDKEFEELQEYIRKSDLDFN